MNTLYYWVGFSVIWLMIGFVAGLLGYAIWLYFRGLIRSIHLCYNMIKRMTPETRKTVTAWRIVKNVYWAWQDMTYHNIKTDTLEFKDGTRMRFWF